MKGLEHHVCVLSQHKVMQAGGKIVPILQADYQEKYHIEEHRGDKRMRAYLEAPHQ